MRRTFTCVQACLRWRHDQCIAHFARRHAEARLVGADALKRRLSETWSSSSKAQHAAMKAPSTKGISTGVPGV